MDKAELRRIGNVLRRAARGSLLDYLDGTLPLLGESKVLDGTREAVAIAKGEVAVMHHFHECPTCEARRKVKALQMKRYREKKRC